MSASELCVPKQGVKLSKGQQEGWDWILLSPRQCFLNLEWGFLTQSLPLFIQELPRNRRRGTKNTSFVTSLFFFLQVFSPLNASAQLLNLPFVFLVCSFIHWLSKHLLSKWYVPGTMLHAGKAKISQTRPLPLKSLWWRGFLGDPELRLEYVWWPQPLPT